MKYFADFHIHSKYSRAVSRDMGAGDDGVLTGIKGIQVLGTGDFTHPLWIKELKEKIRTGGRRIYTKLKNSKVKIEAQQ